MIALPHEHIDDHGGTAGAVLCGAAAKHRGHRPVRVNSVREQERRLTGAGARNPFQSVPVSFEFRLRGVPSTHAHRRRAVALLPEQLVAAPVRQARVERFTAPRRRNFRASLANLIADFVVGKGALIKERVGVVLDAINKDASEPITANRALEFLSGKARRILAWEKEHAKRRVAELERLEREREVRSLVANLNRTAAYLRTTDPDGHRDDVAAIEHTLALAGVLDRALVEAADDGAGR